MWIFVLIAILITAIFAIDYLYYRKQKRDLAASGKTAPSHDKRRNRNTNFDIIDAKARQVRNSRSN